MNTPNLDKIRSVRNPSPLQYAILLYGDEQSASLEDLLDAERAAEILAAMQARIDTLEAGIRRIINCEYDNARTIDAAEKFARELLRGDE